MSAVYKLIYKDFCWPLTHIIHSHFDLKSVSTSGERMYRLRPMPSRRTSPAPRVRLPPRAAASSSGGSTSLRLKPAPRNHHHQVHSSWWSLQQEAACRPHLLLGPTPQMSVQRHHHPHGAATSWLLERSVHHRRVCPCIEPSCRAAARRISRSLSHLVLYQTQRSNDGLVASASPLWLTKAHKPVCMYVWVFMLVYACMYACVMYTCSCIYVYIQYSMQWHVCVSMSMHVDYIVHILVF